MKTYLSNQLGSIERALDLGIINEAIALTASTIETAALSNKLDELEHMVSLLNNIYLNGADALNELLCIQTRFLDPDQSFKEVIHDLLHQDLPHDAMKLCNAKLATALSKEYSDEVEAEIDECTELLSVIRNK